MPERSGSSTFVLMATWSLTGLALVLFSPWPQWVRDTRWLTGWPLADEVAILAPSVLAIGLAWMIGGASSRVAASAAVRVFAGFVLTPILALFLIRDLLNTWLPPAEVPIALGIAFCLADHCLDHLEYAQVGRS